MKNNRPNVYLAIVYILTLLMPIFDYIYKWAEGENSPAVLLRAGVLIIMLIVLLPRSSHIGERWSGVSRMIVFVIFYITIITLVLSPAITSIYALLRVLYPLFGFLFFYYLTKYNKIDETRFARFFLVLIIITAITAYLNIAHRIDTRRGLTVADNTGYAMVCAYAGVMLLVDKKVFPVSLFLVVVGTLICGKRGAIIAMSIASIPVVIYILWNRRIKIKTRILFVMLIAIGVFVALRYFSTYFEAALGRFDNLEDDGGSGRNVIYQSYINQFSNHSHLINQIFGHGLDGGVFGKYQFTRFSAHNDWLELLFDFGIIGTLAYAYLFILMLVTIIKHRRSKSQYFYMLIMSFIIWLIKSILSSTFLMDPNSIYLYMATAYAIAKLEKDKLYNKRFIQYDTTSVVP